ncbi:MAG: zinc ribbon domain-containing protein [Candidatus Omnitrophica bacterium]|nr:zinc ribbon domain-containing protein [Candidatus Omnitrophota bacterium]
MGLTRYICTNCQHRFEAEEKENLECPNCLWSTSLKKEEELKAEETASRSGIPSSFNKTPFNPASLASLWPKLRLFLTIAVLLGILVLAGLFGISLLKKIASGIDKKSPKETIEIQTAPTTGVHLLSEEEKAALYRKVELSATREISEEEKQILAARVSFETGIIEKLPSQTWTLENFQQVIAEQENFYKIPLPGSYKKKLEDVFKKHYLPAAEAFKAGDLLKARDEWVEALAFPVYGDDIRKHRGVVLTMLRVFINDTLSKIGAINGTLVEKTIREKEQALSRGYQELGELLNKSSWPEALTKAQEIEKILQELGRPEISKESAPPYPAGVRQVDADIQATLYNILTSPAPSVVDLTPIEHDILAKKQVIQGLLPESLASAEKVYEEALELIRGKKWTEAEEKLKGLNYPPSLVKDAQEKVKVLKKLS